MLNTVYQLVRPRQFEAVFRDISLRPDQVLVRPTHLSICNADQRYYQGKRPEDVLREKLPMALIHEAIGRVVYDPTGTFREGERVVLIPNIPVETNPAAAENYLRSSLFRGSSIDGFMQEYIQTPPDRVLPLPDVLENDLVAAFTEMVSVSWHAITRFDRTAHEVRGHIGVWGDGNMGFFTALLLRNRFPGVRISVFGVSESKLSDFSFVDDVILVSDVPSDLQIDHAFECVGGNAAGGAIRQMIDCVRPEGTLALLGVSEDPVPIATRMVLEKGLRILGTSRSGREDFAGLLALYQERPQVPAYLERMIGGSLRVRSMRDMTAAFEQDMHKVMGKTVMIWE